MVEVTGIRFKPMGKVYYFDPGDLELKVGTHVIVETSRGVEYGNVAIDRKTVEESRIVPPLKKVLRIATAKDEEIVAQNKISEKEALEICREKAEKRGLAMKLVDVEYTFDNSKILFYFTADGRIDFRELVRDLAAVFKTRIELRQIGVRDEAKMVGGLGVCGRVLCCNSYMTEFQPVSIKMVKEQNLSLNPTKISGTCGRLMCCLKNEQAAYEALSKNAPSVGSVVETPDGKGEVCAVSLLKGIVSVTVDAGNEKEIKDYNLKQIRIIKRHRSKGEKVNLDELKQLED